MTATEKNIEVIGVTQALEGTSGELLYQVTFGVNVEVDHTLQQNLPRNVLGVPPKIIGDNVLILFAKFSGPVPYQVGSRWKLSITTQGEIALKEVKKP